MHIHVHERQCLPSKLSRDVYKTVSEMRNTSLIITLIIIPSVYM